MKAVALGFAAVLTVSTAGALPLEGPQRVVVLTGFVEWPSFSEGHQPCTQRADAVVKISDTLPGGGAAVLELRPFVPGCVEVRLFAPAWIAAPVPVEDEYLLHGSWDSGFRGSSLRNFFAELAVGPYGDGTAIGASGCTPCAWGSSSAVWHGTLRDVVTYVPLT